MAIILKCENISKQYRLGNVGTGTLSHDINRWWHKIRGKEDPYLKIGAVNDRSANATEDYVWAIKDINFDVKKGEVLGIIGKNGAGKSTLLKILSRVTSPTKGSIKTKGRIASLLEVGTGFHPELTGKENIYLNGTILGMNRSEIDSKINEIIEFSGCQMYIDTPVKRYSSGMRVRLAFAVAAFLEPDILVIDEVLAVGDAEFQKKAIGKMQDISKGDGRTVVFVSHNMAAVRNLCTRGIVLEHGVSVFEGDADACVDYYTLSRDERYGFSPKKQLATNDSIRIENIELFNHSFDKIDRVLSGETIHIVMDILNAHEKNQLDFGIGFYDKEDVPQFHCSTEAAGRQIEINDGIANVTLTIPKWPLIQGSFYLNAYIRDGSKTLDHVIEAVWINCEKGDFYNTGILPSWDKGFYCDYEWQ